MGSSVSTEEEVRRLERIYAYYDAGVERRKGDLRNPGNAVIDRERKERVQRWLAKASPRPLGDCYVLDVGCGWGDQLAWLHGLGVPADHLFGIDLLRHRVEAARRAHPDFAIWSGNAERLDFATGRFDLVLCFVLFSSILDRRMARNIVSSISRVLRPDGAVLWYDTRVPNPWNRSTRPMNRRRIRDLFPTWQARLEAITLVPPLARRLGPFTRIAYPWMARIPALRTHYVGVLTRPSGGPGRQ